MKNAQRALEDAVIMKDATALEKYVKELPAMDNTDIFHEAARGGDIQIIQMLLDFGASRFLNQFDDLSFTPLMWAAKNGNWDAVRLLLIAGSDINAHDEPHIGNTVLREVVESASADSIKLLLDLGADPRIPGWMQLTAIDKAEERLEQSPSPESQEILKALRSWKSLTEEEGG